MVFTPVDSFLALTHLPNCVYQAIGIFLLHSTSYCNLSQEIFHILRVLTCILLKKDSVVKKTAGIQVFW